jgi:subtilisin-like proprotein convertase family protein
MFKKITLLLLCIAFCNIAMAQPPCTGLNFTVSPNPVVFDCSGAPQTMVAQGTPNIRYTWEACGQVQTNTDVFVLFQPCFVTVYAQDSLTGCRDTAYIQAIQTQSLFAVVNNDTISCSNPSSVLTANATGGMGAYNYQWNTGQQGQSITVTQQGVYTVTVTDTQFGCTTTATGFVAYNSGFSIWGNTQNPTCANNNGYINVTSNGQGVTYQWVNGGTGPTLQGLSAGQYCVVATDANGCIRDTCFYLQNINGISIDSIYINAPCNGQNVSISILQVTGGTAPYTYLWSTGATTATASNLQLSTNYTVTVTSANGCTTVGNYNTYPQAQMWIQTAALQQPTCSTSNGFITAEAFGGTAPYTYFWNNGTAGATNQGLAQGVYTVTATDAGGCSASTLFTLGNQNTINITGTVTPAGCTGTGVIVVAANTTNATYAWSNGTTGATLTAVAGTYTVTATAGACSNAATFTITTGASSLQYGFLLPDGTGTSVTNTINVSGNPGATISATNPLAAIWANMEHSFMSDVTIKLTCPNNTAVVLKQNGTGGGRFIGTPCDMEANANTRGIGASLVFSASATNTMVNAPTVNVVDACTGTTSPSLPSGNYLPDNPLTSFNGCPLDGAWTISFTDNAAIDNGYLFDWGLQLPGACNSTNNFGSVLTSVGTSATYAWSNGQTTPTLQNVVTGTYTATITDGCSSIMATVTIPTSAYAINVIAASCLPNATDGSATVSFAAGATPTIAWSNGQTGATATGLATGWYSVTMTNAGCVTQRNVFVPASTVCVASITGFVLNDNGNCIKDAADVAVSNIMIRCTNTVTGAAQYDFTDAQGFYTFRVDTGHYIVNYYTQSCDGYTLTCPQSGNINVHAALPNTSYTNNNFFRIAATGTYSLSAYLYKTTARPGFGQTFTLYYNNNNGAPINATMTFTHDPLLNAFTVTSGATPVYNSGTRTATWALSLAAYAQGSVTIHCDMAQSVALGLPVSGSLSLTAVGTDVCPNDNSDNWTSITTNSYDPNDKQITVRQNAAQQVSYSDHTGKDLLYQIQFQNTGSDTAYTVMIRDTLDTAILDISTIKLLGSTHNCTLEWENTNVLKLHFYNINLPHLAAAGARSQGHAVFSVRTKTGVAASSQVVLRNRAAIYFDYNTPIITNRVVTTLMPPLAVTPPSAVELQVRLFPNPTDANATLAYDLVEQTTLSITLLDINGRTLRTLQAKTTQQAGTHQANIDVNDLAAGVYLLQISTDKGVQTHKLVRQ